MASEAEGRGNGMEWRETDDSARAQKLIDSVEFIDDPRHWDFHADWDKIVAHLARNGISEPIQRTRDLLWDAAAPACDDLAAELFPFGAWFLFSNTWDVRVVDAVRSMPEPVRKELVSIGAHKGGCSLLFWRTIPDGYERHESFDNWVIDEATTVQCQMDRAFRDCKIRESRETKPPEPRKKYQQYLQSDVWQITRAHALEHYGSTCCLCGSKTHLQVHHRTYARRGREALADLIVLCDTCHHRYHKAA